MTRLLGRSILICMNPTPSVREFLDSREGELQRRIEEVHRTLVPLEAELADVRKAKAAITTREEAQLKGGYGKSHTLAILEQVDAAMKSSQPPPFPPPIQQSLPIPATVIPPPPGPPPSPPSPYAGLTQQQLVIKALSEHYKNGATATELVDFFHNAWGREDIVRSSLSPQLSRLKSEHKIDLIGRVWILLPPNAEAPADHSEGASNSSSQEVSRPTWGH